MSRTGDKSDRAWLTPSMPAGPGTPASPRRSLFPAVHRHWRSYGWGLVTGLAALTSLILGFVGFGEQSPSLSPVDRLYATVQLFQLDTAATPPLNIYLDLARWLAPLSVASAAIQALFAVFAKQVERWNLHRMNDHVVICGLGRCGQRLAKSFREEMPVVVIERNPASEELKECRNLDIHVLLGDATKDDVIQEAGLERAKYLVAVCGNDSVNSKVALAALSRAGSRQRGAPLRCFIHIEDLQLSGLLEESALGEPAHGKAQSAQFEWFNVYRMGPRAVLNAHPTILRVIGAQSPHLIVVGSGPIGLNLVAEAARQWSFESHASPIRITLVAPDASEQCKRLSTRYPRLPRACDLATYDADPADVSRPARELKIEQPSGHSPTTAVVCIEDDDACLRATIQVRKALPNIDVVVCTMGSSGVANLFSESTSGLLSTVRESALLDIACTSQVLLNGVREQIAQAIHADYVNHRLQEDRLDTDPALAPWDSLPEALRESNRGVADDIGRKLGTVHCELEPADDWEKPSFAFSDADMETLAEDEHKRWMEERQRDRWRYGPVRDPEQKISPYLKSWSELDQEIQDYDRQSIRGLPLFLAQAGFTIVSRTSTT